MKKELVKATLEKLLKAGAGKASCSLTDSEKHEINIENGEFTLFRTTFDTDITLNAYVDGSKGSVALNKTDQDSIDTAVNQAIAMARASKPDEAHDISESQRPVLGASGPEHPDPDMMFSRLEEYRKTVTDKYPKIKLESAIADFTGFNRILVNSNGVECTERLGYYGFSTLFTAKDGMKTSSMNYSGIVSGSFDCPLISYARTDQLLEQTSGQLEPGRIPEKFTGPVIVVPDCLDNFIGFILQSISVEAMISGTSLYRDKLNEKIAGDKLTVESRPVDDDFAWKSYFTSDGYRCENHYIVQEGILKSYLLGLYGSRKTGKPRAKSNGSNITVAAGDVHLADMIASVKQGLLVSRFSGGRPAPNGNFSGVAKNSYYIKDGKISHPVKETMISGNMADMLKNITAVSSEQIDFGYGKSPWMMFDGVTVS